MNFGLLQFAIKPIFFVVIISVIGNIATIHWAVIAPYISFLPYALRSVTVLFANLFTSQTWSLFEFHLQFCVLMAIYSSISSHLHREKS